MASALLERISGAQLISRKTRDELGTALLTTLLSEATMVGKNNGNRESTDSEVVGVIKKFIASTKENLTILEDRIAKATKPGMGAVDPALTQAKIKSTTELRILESFLPKQLEGAELAACIDEVFRTWPSTPTMKDMGNMMKEVRSKTNGNCDMAVVSNLVKHRLTGM